MGQMEADQKKINPWSVYPGAFIGWMVDGFDLSMMFLLIPILAPQFFPKSSAIAIIGVWSIYTITLVCRPLGGILFGILGDKIGRRKAIFAAVAGLGISVFLTGFLPNYHSIGVWAPISLTFLRVLTGIFAGGEYSNSAVIIVESAEKNKRGRWGGAIQAGYAVGFLVAAILFLFLHYAIPKESFANYGWRWMFWSSIVLTVIALLVVKYRMIESAKWEKAKEEGKTKKMPLTEILKNGETLKEVLTGILFMVGMSWIYGLTLGFFPTVLALGKQFIFPQTLYVVIIALTAAVIGYLFSGFVSDFIGRRRTVITFSLITMIVSLFSTQIISKTNDFTYCAIFASILGFFSAGLYGVTPTYLSERFSTHIRSTAVGISFNFGFIFGNWGTAILLVFTKISSSNFPNMWSAFIIFGEALVMLSALLSKETKDVELR
jgi:MFS family permease